MSSLSFRILSKEVDCNTSEGMHWSATVRANRPEQALLSPRLPPDSIEVALPNSRSLIKENL